MEKRSDRYKDPVVEENNTRSRVNKNRLLAETFWQMSY